MEASPAPLPQRACPYCARLSRATGSRCPYCQRSFRRRVLPAVAAMLAVTAALVLGGVYLMLTAFGEELDSELESQVERVEEQFERDLRGVRRDIRRELDRRLPAPSSAP
jgi:hypothetical protein